MLKITAPKARAGVVQKARNLRREMTLPEVLLWRELKKQPYGLKFRRQHPSGDYICDFFCSDARLAIEVDGAAHDRGERPERDAVRDAWFAGHGIATLRVSAADVLRDLGRAVEAIVAAARARLPLHHPAAPGGPPPQAELGED